MFKVLSIYILLLLPHLLSAADSTDTENEVSKPFYSTICTDINSALSDYKLIDSNLSCFSTTDVAITAGVIAGTGISMFFDKDLRKIAKRNQSDFAGKIFEISEEAGNIWYVSGFGGIIYLSGLACKNEDLRITGRLVFESLALSGLFTIALKAGLGRARPYLNTGSTDYRFFELDDSFWSLPSGHASVAFTLASVLSARIDKWWAYSGFFAVATLTGIARIYNDKHWFSDVVLSAGISTITGFAVVNAEKSRKIGANQSFIIIPSARGITFLYYL